MLDGKRVQVEIPSEVAQELGRECGAMLAEKSIEVKPFRKFTGRASWAAGLVPELSPHLATCWAALGRVARGETDDGEGAEAEDGSVTLIPTAESRRKRRQREKRLGESD